MPGSAQERSGHRREVVPPAIVARFWLKVWKPNLDDCWIWTGACNPKGYGTFRWGDKFINAHRFVMILVLGRHLARTEQVDHLCRVKQCCNPLHLERVTASVNTARAKAANPAIEF